MKNILAISVLLLACGQSNAAIMYQTYGCGVTHAADSQSPMPDAPHYGLRCYINVGGISGKSANCSLLTNTLLAPPFDKSETALKTVSYVNGIAIMKNADTTVKLNVSKGVASIKLGNSQFAECKYIEPKI